jgi:hypothetical protein
MQREAKNPDSTFCLTIGYGFLNTCDKYKNLLFSTVIKHRLRFWAVPLCHQASSFYKGSLCLHSARNYSPNDTAKDPKRNESQAPPLLEPQIHNKQSFSLIEFLHIQISSVTVVTKLKADDMRNFGSIPNRGKKPVTSPKTVTLALRPIQPPIQEVTHGLFPLG